jgi:heptosyltransferase-2
MKILVIQQKMIGDVLTSTILFEVLRKKYPNAQLHYLIYKHTSPVVENNPFIDDLILYEEAYEKPKNFFSFLKTIRKKKYDVIIDVYSKLGTALISLTSGAKTTISYDKWYTAFCYTNTCHRKYKAETAAGFAIENRLRLLEPLTVEIPLNIKPKIYLTVSEVESARETLAEAGCISQNPLFMISVLGSSENKTYPHNYLAVLLDQIFAETNANLLFNYIPSQVQKAKDIFKRCNEETKKNIHLEVFGRSLREFMALTSCCNALIGNEGGAVNMAKALNISTFSIFSPSISKQDWSIFEDDPGNVSIHLKDFKPQLFGGKDKKELRAKSKELYEEFRPELISEKLSEFLKIIPK